LTPEGKRAAIAEFANSEAAQAVDTATAAVKAQRDYAAQQVEAIHKALVSQVDTAQEIRNGRAWQRARAKLDVAAKDGKLAAVAQKGIQRAERGERSVIVEMLPDYLEAQGVDAGFVDTALAAAVPEYGAARDALGAVSATSNAPTTTRAWSPRPSWRVDR
jgi:hypothetical protein